MFSPIRITSLAHIFSAWLPPLKRNCKASRRGVANQGQGACGRRSALRRSAISGRTRRGRSSQRLLSSRRQLTLHAAKRNLRPQDCGRSRLAR
jgi:hypothetical protein